VSNRLDPFASLPVNLSSFEECLINFYLSYYPQIAYGFSPILKPHPVATSFEITINTPACFHVVLARAALYQLSLNKTWSLPEQKALKLAVLQHKGEALKAVRILSMKKSLNQGQKGHLLSSIISLATLDRRTNAAATADWHTLAVRRLVKSIGDPSTIQPLVLSRVMLFFECIYGTDHESWVWDMADFPWLLADCNKFLSDTVKRWAVDNRPSIERESLRCRLPVVCLKTDTALLKILSLPLLQLELASQTHSHLVSRISQKLEHELQMICLLTIAVMTHDYARSLEALQMRIDGINQTIAEQMLSNQSSNNILWYLQISDHSRIHSRRVWRAAGFAWIMKRYTTDTQSMLKHWLIRFLMGELVDGIELTPPHSVTQIDL
jgi:hypothetical protein